MNNSSKYLFDYQVEAVYVWSDEQEFYTLLNTFAGLEYRLGDNESEMIEKLEAKTEKKEVTFTVATKSHRNGGTTYLVHNQNGEQVAKRKTSTMKYSSVLVCGDSLEEMTGSTFSGNPSSLIKKALDGPMTQEWFVAVLSLEDGSIIFKHENKFTHTVTYKGKLGEWTSNHKSLEDAEKAVTRQQEWNESVTIEIKKL